MIAAEGSLSNPCEAKSVVLFKIQYSRLSIIIDRQEANSNGFIIEGGNVRPKRKGGKFYFN
jgi:hypothetical protein